MAHTLPPEHWDDEALEERLIDHDLVEMLNQPEPAEMPAFLIMEV